MSFQTIGNFSFFTLQMNGDITLISNCYKSEVLHSNLEQIGRTVITKTRQDLMNFFLVSIVSAIGLSHPLNKSHVLINLNCILYLNNSSQIAKSL